MCHHPLSCTSLNLRIMHSRLKRLYVFVAFVWAVFLLIVEIRIPEMAPLEFILLGIISPTLGYFFFFRIIPWIVRRFR
jgi:hypothetical protein